MNILYAVVNNSPLPRRDQRDYTAHWGEDCKLLGMMPLPNLGVGEKPISMTGESTYGPAPCRRVPLSLLSSGEGSRARKVESWYFKPDRTALTDDLEFQS